MNPDLVGKGDCYEANFHLMAAMDQDGIECELVHGIITAADFYQHMEEGTQFMHAWVEAKHAHHGWVICDASLCKDTDTPFTMNSLKKFYETLNPTAVIRMKPGLACMMFNKHRWFGNWDLHPAHSRCGK